MTILMAKPEFEAWLKDVHGGLANGTVTGRAKDLWGHITFGTNYITFHFPLWRNYNGIVMATADNYGQATHVEVPTREEEGWDQYLKCIDKSPTPNFMWDLYMDARALLPPTPKEVLRD